MVSNANQFQQMSSEHTGRAVAVADDEVLQNGFYYNRNTGVFEGQVINWVGDKERVFSCTGKSGDKYLDATQLNITHREFRVCATIICQEAEIDGMECICIAFTANNRARKRKITMYKLLMSSYSSVDNMNKVEMILNTKEQRKLDSRKGLISALLAEKDPTNGAEFWDGTDFLAWGLNGFYNRKSHAKFREYSKITISKPLYEKYLSAQLEKYKSGTVSYGAGSKKKVFKIPAAVFRDPKNWKDNKFEYITGVKSPPAEGGLIASIVEGYTIFWRINR